MANLSNVPTFNQTPNLKYVQVTTANTNRDGTTGTYSSVLSWGANGGLVDWIKFQAIVTTAAGTLRIFISNDSGSTWRLLDEVPTQGATPSGTVPGETHVWTPPNNLPLNIPINGQLKFNVNNSETWNCIVQEGDF